MKFAAPALLTFAGLSLAKGALSWVGAGDGISLYQEANWLDDNGVQPGANQINPNTAVTAATGGLIEISSGTGTPSNFGGTFNVGTGNSLTVSNGRTLRSVGRSDVVGGGAGSTLTVDTGATLSVGDLSGFENYNFDGATADLSSITTSAGTLSSSATSFQTVNSTINGGTTGTVESMLVSGNFGSSGTVFVQFGDLTLQNATGSLTGMNATGGSTNINLVNSAWTSTFLAFNVSITLDAASSLTLNGAGDPINSQGGAPSSVNLVAGSQLTMSSVAEFAEQGNEIFIYGVSYNSDPSLLVFNGNTATAIPEPSTGILALLAGFFLLGRRSRR